MSGRKKEEGRMTLDEIYNDFKKTEEYKTATAKQVNSRFYTYLENNYKIVKKTIINTD